MLRHFDEPVTLRSFPPAIQDANGYEAPGTPTDSVVWGDVKSVGRTEFYKSMAVGVEVSKIVTVNALDYGNQKTVLIGGRTYNVVRAYQSTLDEIELTCAEAVS
jgi:SPP1 family predicted phage head-tail adaptor